MAQDAGAIRPGHDRGCRGAETANNAHANAALIPLLTLGIPGMAIVGGDSIGAFTMKGIESWSVPVPASTPTWSGG